MNGEEKKNKSCLTVYTASAASTERDWPLDHMILGSYLRRGDAIRSCAEYVIQKMTRMASVRMAMSEDSRVVNALKGAGMSEDEIDSMFRGGGRGQEWVLPAKERRIIKDMVADVIGSDGCFIVRTGWPDCAFRFDVDENDVEGKGGLQLWTCITSGIDGEDHDPEWEQVFPEVYLSREDAVECAICDLLSCLEGYDEEECGHIISEAKDSIAEHGYFVFYLSDRLSRRWDIWSTPLDVGCGSGKSKRA